MKSLKGGWNSVPILLATAGLLLVVAVLTYQWTLGLPGFVAIPLLSRALGLRRPQPSPGLRQQLRDEEAQANQMRKVYSLALLPLLAIAGLAIASIWFISSR